MLRFTHSGAICACCTISQTMRRRCCGVLQKRQFYMDAELGDSNPAASNTVSEELNAFLDATNQQLADFQAIDRVRTTVSAIEQIAQRVSALPGRKNLVWISGGFPFSIGMEEMSPDSRAANRACNDEVEHAARAVTAAQLAIYPVDARGLVTAPDLSPEMGPVRRGARPVPPPLGAAMKPLQTMDAKKYRALIRTRL